MIFNVPGALLPPSGTVFVLSQGRGFKLIVVELGGSRAISVAAPAGFDTSWVVSRAA
jgi:hypothetical protein